MRTRFLQRNTRTPEFDGILIREKGYHTSSPLEHLRGSIYARVAREVRLCCGRPAGAALSGNVVAELAVTVLLALVGFVRAKLGRPKRSAHARCGPVAVPLLAPRGAPPQAAVRPGAGHGAVPQPRAVPLGDALGSVLWKFGSHDWKQLEDRFGVSD